MPLLEVASATRATKTGDDGVRHGAPSPVDVETFLGDDPALALVTAPLHDKCDGECDGECDGLCECDEGSEPCP